MAVNLPGKIESGWVARQERERKEKGGPCLFLYRVVGCQGDRDAKQCYNLEFAHFLSLRWQWRCAGAEQRNRIRTS